MAELNNWSPVAANNNSAPPNGFPENMNYSEVNDAARETMAVVSRWYRDNNGSLSTAGTSTAYTLSLNATGYSSYFTGMQFAASMHATNGATPTINVNGIGAASIVDRAGNAIGTGELVTGRRYEFRYNGTGFEVLNLESEIGLKPSNNLSDVSDIATARSNLGAPGLNVDNVFTGSQTLSSTAPNQFFTETDAGVDSKTWQWRINGGIFTGRLVDDALSAATSWIEINRTGLTVNTINFPNGTPQKAGVNIATVNDITNANWSGAALDISNGGTGADSASAARTNLGLGSIATLNSINNSNWSGTDLALANGGTGASDASSARTNLGLAIGSDVQAHSAGLASIAGLTTAADRMIYTTASNVYAVTTLTAFARTLLADASNSAARSTLGLGTLATLSSINDGNWSGTDLAVANGGTGASTAADARTNLGLGSLATLSSINDGNWSGTDLAVANGGTGSSSASGARTNLGLGSLATLNTINNSNWSGTDLAVANGGTGVSSLSSLQLEDFAVTVSTSNPSGGSNGDFWFVREV